LTSITTPYPTPARGSRRNIVNNLREEKKRRIIEAI
jgi:hypothetical protein